MLQYIYKEQTVTYKPTNQPTENKMNKDLVNIFKRGDITIINTRGTDLNDRITYLRTSVEIRKLTGASVASVKILMERLKKDPVWSGVVA